jgi:hypothetical protein
MPIGVDSTLLGSLVSTIKYEPLTPSLVSVVLLIGNQGPFGERPAETNASRYALSPRVFAVIVTRLVTQPLHGLLLCEETF